MTSKWQFRQRVMEAVHSMDLVTAQILVEGVVDMYEKSFFLMAAIRNSNPAAAQCFIDAGADPFVQRVGVTSLVLAVKHDNVEILGLMLANYLPLNKEGEASRLYKLTRGINEALFEAASYCSLSCLQYLLEHGGNVNVYYYHDDEFLSFCTPIIAASYAPSSFRQGITQQHATDCAKLLIEHGADVNKANYIGDTALHWACANVLVELVRLLLQNGAEVDSPNSIGKSPLMYLCEQFKAEKYEAYMSAAELLIQHGADVKVIAPDGWSVLHYAISSESLPLVKLLINAGANLNPPVPIPCSHENVLSCLSLAAERDNNEILHLLLQWNAQTPLHAKFTPLCFAVANCNLRAVKLLYYNSTSESNDKLLGLIEGSDILGSNRPLPDYMAPRSEWVQFMETLKKPFPLRQICRLAIRHYVGKDLVKADLFLPLPRALIQYIKDCVEC